LPVSEIQWPAGPVISVSARLVQSWACAVDASVAHPTQTVTAHPATAHIARSYVPRPKGNTNQRLRVGWHVQLKATGNIC